MTTNVLHIDSSLFGASGVSAQLGSNLMTTLGETLGDLNITHRDLGREPLPHFDADTIAAIGEGRAELADTLIAELQAADILVLGVPMYNFGIPSVLKAWFDHVARAGTTFKYTETGPVGLLENKKVFVITTRGGKHRDAPTDTQTPYLQTMLGFLGLKDVQFIYAEGLNLSGGVREEAVALAEAEIASGVKALAIGEVA